MASGTEPVNIPGPSILKSLRLLHEPMLSGRCPAKHICCIKMTPPPLFAGPTRKDCRDRHDLGGHNDLHLQAPIDCQMFAVSVHVEVHFTPGPVRFLKHFFSSKRRQATSSSHDKHLSRRDSRVSLQLATSPYLTQPEMCPQVHYLRCLSLGQDSCCTLLDGRVHMHNEGPGLRSEPYTIWQAPLRVVAIESKGPQ